MVQPSAGRDVESSSRREGDCIYTMTHRIIFIIILTSVIICIIEDFECGARDNLPWNSRF